eukprot:COSAG04_NODE_719_length_10829_cov_6.915750_2_plen_169_part_00
MRERSRSRSRSRSQRTIPAGLGRKSSVGASKYASVASHHSRLTCGCVAVASLAQVLETADRSGWIIVGQWQNLPGASTPDEVRCGAPASGPGVSCEHKLTAVMRCRRFIAHPNHAARAPSPVSSATSSDLSSAEEEEEEEEEEAEPDSTEESDSSSDSGGEDSTKPSA